MISSETRKWIYNGDGSTTTFQYTNKIFADTDLVVVLKHKTTGVETTQTLNSDYTVTGAGDENGGNVVFTTAPSSDYKVIIYCDVPLTQTTDYVENDEFPAESHEDALDKLTIIAQQLQEQVDRALLRDLDQTSSLTFPDLESGKYLTNDGSSLSWNTPTATDYGANMSYGADASKSSSPTVGDIYVATDTQKVYICWSSGTWSEYAPTSSKIEDADGDTSLDVETSSDSDTIIGKVAGTEALKVSSDGIVTLAKQSAARVYQSSDQSIPDSTTTKLTFDTTDIDIQSEFDTTNSKFVAKEAGIYRINFQVRWKSTVDQSSHWIGTYKNGSNYNADYLISSGTGQFNQDTSCIISLAANDYLEFKVYQSTGGAVLTNGSYTIVEIHKLS